MTSLNKLPKLVVRVRRKFEAISMVMVVMVVMVVVVVVVENHMQTSLPEKLRKNRQENFFSPSPM